MVNGLELNINYPSLWLVLLLNTKIKVIIC